MQKDRLRSLVEDIERALGPDATAERVAAIAESVLRSVVTAPAPHPGEPLALLLHLPLHDLSDTRRSGVEAHAWDRVTRIGASVSTLAAKRFAAVPIRCRISSFSALCAGVPEGDLVAVAHRLDATAAEAGVDRLLVPWATLDEPSPADRRVVRALPSVLSESSRLHGMVSAGRGASTASAPASYATLLSHAVRAGVLDAADRLLIGVPDPSASPIPRIEAVVSAGSPEEAAECGDSLAPALHDMSRRVTEWTGCALAPPAVVVCADCRAAEAPAPVGGSLLPLRYRGWPVSAPEGWGTVTPARLEERLHALLRADVPGVFRLDESPNPRSPSSP